MKLKSLILGLFVLFSLTAVHAQQNPAKSRHQTIEKQTNRKFVAKKKAHKAKHRKNAAFTGKRINAKQNKRFIRKRKSAKAHNKYQTKQMRLDKKYLRKAG